MHLRHQPGKFQNFLHPGSHFMILANETRWAIATNHSLHHSRKRPISFYHVTDGTSRLSSFFSTTDGRSSTKPPECDSLHRWPTGTLWHPQKTSTSTQAGVGPTSTESFKNQPRKMHLQKQGSPLPWIHFNTGRNKTWKKTNWKLSSKQRCQMMSKPSDPLLDWATSSRPTSKILPSFPLHYSNSHERTRDTKEALYQNRPWMLLSTYANNWCPNQWWLSHALTGSTLRSRTPWPALPTPQGGSVQFLPKWTGKENFAPFHLPPDNWRMKRKTTPHSYSKPLPPSGGWITLPNTGWEKSLYCT